MFSAIINGLEKEITKRPKSFMELTQSWRRNWEIGNRYSIEKIVGSGSYGEVAKAYDNQKKEIVGIRRRS